MYKTPAGTRVLQGAERRLVVESLSMIVDLLTVDELSTDVQVLEDLTRNQRIAAYRTVARALLADDEPPPALTAVVEATAASIYGHVRNMVSQEVSEDFSKFTDLSDFDDGELPEDGRWRELTVAAGRELGIEELPEATDQDPDAWDLLIECLKSQVLWDNDWEMVDQMDAAPEAARRLRDELGIEDDYFVAIPPDPDDADAERLLAELRRLARDGR